MLRKVRDTERFMLLFEGLEEGHGTHGTPVQDEGEVKWKIKNTAKTVREPVTMALVEKHLDGKRPLGIIPIRADNTASWGSIDIDEYDADMAAIVETVHRMKLPLLPTRSKSGGLHLYLFLKTPAPAKAVQAALRDIAAATGFAKSEIFPKQTKIDVEKGDLGQWILLPYYGDDYHGKLKMQYGLKRTMAEMTFEEFLTAAEKLRVDPEELELLRTKKTKKEGAAAKGKAPFSDGPPCLQHMAAIGIPQGGQNNTAFHMGVYYKRAFPEDWQKRLEEANQDFMRPPLPSDNLAGVIRSLEKKDYEYKCKDQPMCSHCDSVKCRGRKFGVGAGGGAYPEIKALTKLMTEPAVWFVDVEDQHIAMSSEELQNYMKFHRLCMEHANVCYRMVPQALWLLIVSEAMTNVHLLPAPPDVSLGGQFEEILEHFLTNSRRGKVKEDMLSGRPWEDDESQRHYFSLKSLMRTLERDGMRNMKRVDVTERLKKLGGQHAFFNIKGKGLNVWSVSSGAFAPIPEIPTPQSEQEDV